MALFQRKGIDIHSLFAAQILYHPSKSGSEFTISAWLSSNWMSSCILTRWLTIPVSVSYFHVSFMAKKFINNHVQLLFQQSMISSIQLLFEAASFSLIEHLSAKNSLPQHSFYLTCGRFTHQFSIHLEIIPCIRFKRESSFYFS